MIFALFFYIFVFLLIKCVFNSIEDPFNLKKFLRHGHTSISFINSVEMEILMNSVHLNQIEHVYIPKITLNSLKEKFDSIERKSGKVYYVVQWSNQQELDEHIWKVLDDFLTPRLWYSLKRLVFACNSSLIERIVIERVSEDLEYMIKPLAAKNYPIDVNQCSKRPLAVSNVCGDSWGNRGINLVNFLGSHRKHVTYLTFTLQYSNISESPYASTDECTDRVNKFECVFLPSTSCPLPKTLVNGKDIPRLADPSKLRLVYNQSTYNAPLMDEDKEGEYENTIYRNLPNFDVTRGKHLTAKRWILNEIYSYMLTNHTPFITKSSVLSVEMEMTSVDSLINYFGYAHRYKSDFTLRVQNLMDRFRTSTIPHFYSNLTCTMVHIRKNDRTIPGHSDMLSWCLKHCYPNPVTKVYTAINSPGQNIPNFGCNLALPYGAASIEHFLNASLLISPENKNIYIATDDESWLHQALGEYLDQPHNLIRRLQLNIFPFHARRGHRGLNDRGLNVSMEVAAEFFATIELGRQCNAFVGYIESSAAARLMYHALCYRSSGRYFNCPTVFDMSAHGMPGGEYHV